MFLNKKNYLCRHYTKSDGMTRYKISILLILLILSFCNCALPADEDENPESLEGDDYITYTLPWEGETDKFAFPPGEGLRLNASDESGGEASIAFPSTATRNTRWEFGVRLTFNPSANNFARFYLTASSAMLSGSLDGYYLQIGGAKDNVALYRQQGVTRKLLASGRELMKGNNSPELYIKAECDNNGYWSFWTQLESESEYTLEKQVKDDTLPTSSYSGVYCKYTKTRSTGFTFHHVRQSYDVETNTTPEETPDQPETDTPEQNPGYTELPEDVRGMLLFNEIMYNNANDGAEYVELYNPTTATIVLPEIYLYKMYADGKVFSTTLLCMEDSAEPLTFAPGGYLCFTKSPQTLVRKHGVEAENAKNIVYISNFPALSNEGGYLALSSTKTPGTGHTFDTCRFRDEMHDIGSGKSKKGISLEKKSPELPSLNANWRSSRHASGGTPGAYNGE